MGFACRKNFKRQNVYGMKEVVSDSILKSLIKWEGKHWSLVQTRPRNEKFSAKNCSAQGILVYLPLITKVHVHNRSERKISLPMFSGYFFACPNYDEETLIRRDKCVWNLKVLNEAEEEELLKDLRIVRESELLAVDHKLIVNPGICEGQTVRLKKGPFESEEVLVVRREGISRVIVNLSFLGRNITVTCEANDLEY